MTWRPYDGGATIGTTGSENGTIVIDEEHVDGARITLERDGYQPWSITCGVYGAMVHTRSFSDQTTAEQELAEMKSGLEQLLVADDERLIDDFVRRFP